MVSGREGTVGAACALALWLAGAAASGEKERPMADFQITVDKVAAFEKGQGPGEAEVKLQGGTACLIDRTLPQFDVWAQLLQKSLEYGWYLYVACEPSNRQLKVLLPSASHNVELVEPDPQGDRLRIRFRKSHAIHVLKRTHPRYDEIERALTQAATSGSQVLVTTNPREMEIIDLRPAPAPTAPEKQAPRP